MTTARHRFVVAALWILSLVFVAQCAGSAQSNPPVGQEVRFLRSEGTGTGHRGILIANFGGQWLPVTLDEMPDANMLIRPSSPRQP
jgi:hypothetical protein